MSLFAISSAGKGTWHHGARGDGEFPIDRAIHDPDRIRSKGQMEAALIRPIVHQKLAMEEGAGSMEEVDGLTTKHSEGAATQCDW